MSAWLSRVAFGSVRKRIAVLRCGFHAVCYRRVASLQTKPQLLGVTVRYKANRVGKAPFSTYEIPASALSLTNTEDQGLARLIEAYRLYGHKQADITPSLQVDTKCEELNLEKYGLTADTTVTLADGQTIIVEDLVAHLKSLFCGPLSIETGHLVTASERDFISNVFIEEKQFEPTSNDRRRIAEVLLKSEAFDQFVHSNFDIVKRYGGEGVESMGVFAEEIFKSVASSETEDIIMGMPHRGRLNLLALQLKLPPKVIFRKIKGLSEFPDDMLSIATGDVLSHLISSCDLNYDGSKVHVTMLPCPSHLEAVNPVALGKCRARQQSLSNDITDTTKALCLLMHGDSAISGQGIVAECLNMSNLQHFSVGGAIHLIVNNQVGFSMPPYKGRSSMYASDIAKFVGCPILHVNGDHPEDVARAARIALKYRNTFHKDVVVDLICYRKLEQCEQSPSEAYVTHLVDDGVLSPDDVADWKTIVQNEMSQHLKDSDSFRPPVTYLQRQWSGMQFGSDSQTSKWDTGFPVEDLGSIGIQSLKFPDARKMFIDSRKAKNVMSSVDWVTAETLAFGSLLCQGYNIRICGQDVGCDSNRHAPVICQDSENMHFPLNHIAEEQRAKIEVVNSLLSEEAVLGFEYGMSIESPNRLNIWEAQFGDFFNGAQIIFDTFIASGEARWLQQSGLVVLLPHGYDGMGPEHSSCRIERFLQLTDSKENGIDTNSVNLHICNPTTPAQYFHLLRRQMVRNYRKPLIIASPKILLSLPAATSPLTDMAPGTSFQPVLGDLSVKNKSKTKKILFCSGKHYYALVDERERLGLDSTVAIVRLEELCPFPSAHLHKEIASFTNAESYIWAQEEPRNMGAWSFVHTRFENILGVKLRYAGRPVLPTPAVGIGTIHKKQVKEILNAAFNS